MIEKAVFAGGCFWCMVSPFDTQPGIYQVRSGYTGGHKENPTYQDVMTQESGHTEAVEITFDPSVMSYQDLLEIYWTVTDPTDASGQFHDRGSSYRPVIFYLDEEQKKTAVISKNTLEASGKYTQPVVTQIEQASVFYEAEEEHQNFYKKDKERYLLEKEERKAYSIRKKEELA